jgi:hypothetical protein
MPLSDIYKDALNSIRNNFNSELLLYAPSLPSLDPQNVIFGVVDAETKELETTGIVGEPIIVYDLQHSTAQNDGNYSSGILTLRLKVCFRETTKEAEEAVIGYLLDYSQVMKNIFIKKQDCGAVYFEDGGTQNGVDNNLFLYTLSLNIQFHYA